MGRLDGMGWDGVGGEPNGRKDYYRKLQCQYNTVITVHPSQVLCYEVLYCSSEQCLCE